MENVGRTLLITGAAGRVGSFYRRWLHETGQVGEATHQWRLRLTDVRRQEETAAGPEGSERAHEEVVAGPEIDLADLEVARRVVRGAHSVVHLAADPSPRADFYGSLLDRNIKAPCNVLQAVVEAGVRRVILCSSINAVNGYAAQRQVRASDVPFPGNVYGATKAFSEALAGAFVSLRLRTGRGGSSYGRGLGGG